MNPPGERTTSRSAKAVLVVWLPVLVGAWLAAPHLGDELWYDEAYTLDFFATGDPTLPLRDYHAPNNHILFSIALGQWRMLAPELAGMRALPAIAFLASVALLVAGVRRLWGSAPALLAGMLYVGSHVTLNFALQLRGYGPSWLPVTVAWFALATPGPLGPVRRLAYLGAAVVAMGILPTNLVPLAALSFWRLGSIATVDPGARRSLLGEAAVLCLAPLLGLGWYVGVREQMAAGAVQFAQGGPLLEAVLAWLVPTLRDFAWLAPLALVGAFVSGRDLRVADPRARRAARSRGMLVFAVLLVPLTAFALAPHRPATRVLVPLLPIWYAALASLLAGAISWLCRGQRRREAVATVLLCVALAGAAGWRESHAAGFQDRHRGDPQVMDLYDLYIHQDFRPSVALDWLEAEAEREATTLFLDRSDLWSVVYLGKTRYREGLWSTAYVALHDSPDIDDETMGRLLEGRRVLLLTRSAAAARAMAAHLAGRAPEGWEPPGAPRRVLDTGYFEVYELAAPEA